MMHAGKEGGGGWRVNVSSGVEWDGETSGNVDDCITEGVMVSEGLR